MLFNTSKKEQVMYVLLLECARSHTVRWCYCMVALSCDNVSPHVAPALFKYEWQGQS